MKRQKLSIDPAGDGSTLEALHYDGDRLIQITQPAQDETERLFESIRKVDFTQRLLGREESEGIESQAILPEDHFKDAKQRIKETIQEVQRLMEVVTLLHPRQTVDGATLIRIPVEQPRMSQGASTVIRGVAVLAKRQHLQAVSHRLGRNAESLQSEAEITKNRIQQLTTLRRNFQLLGSTQAQDVVVQTSCPPAPPAQVQIQSSSDGALICPELEDCKGLEECSAALDAEIRTNFERGLFDALCAEARLSSIHQVFVVQQLLQSSMRINAGVAGVVDLELVDGNMLQVQRQGQRVLLAEQMLRAKFRKQKSRTQKRGALLRPMVGWIQHDWCRGRILELLNGFVVEHQLPEPHWHSTSCVTTTVFELRAPNLSLYGTLDGIVLSITNASTSAAHTQTLTVDEIPMYLESILTHL
eukprot:TRINITY_DN2659_c0_g1_i2.p1 TRINITY_DN2659_c0_g1~~TRINITY_DN2659_c0_g1_i2.p1  ORF type:complete len:415 (-),score=89.29 TRINITY_DN2659_c0_g1_i2:84-1328(-)